MDVSSIAFERSQTGFHYLFRDVFLLTVANSRYDRVNRYMMTEERIKGSCDCVLLFLTFWSLRVDHRFSFSVSRCVSTDCRETHLRPWEHIYDD